MKKIQSLLALILALSLTVTMMTGCASKASYSGYEENVSATPAAANGAYKADGDYGYYTEAAVTEEVWEDEVVYADDAVDESLPEAKTNDSKLIYYAYVSIETITYDETLQKIRQMTDQYGGYFEYSDTTNYGSYRYASYTVRIPSENYRSFVTAANEMQMVVTFNESVENVSSEYYDTQSRLESAKKELESYEALYAEATEIEDMLAIKGYINDVQYRIDWLSGELRNYDSLVGYSTVSISVSEVAKLRGQETPAIGFGARVAAAFKEGWRSFTNGLENFVIGFAENFVGWIIFLGVVALVTWLIVRKVRKNKAKKEEIRKIQMQYMTAQAQQAQQPQQMQQPQQPQ